MTQINQNLKMFSIEFYSRASVETILENALKHNFNCSVDTPIHHSNEVTELVKTAYVINTPSNLHAYITITQISVDLEPKEPYIFKLHLEESTSSIDYAEYLMTLLTLCENIEIESLSTKSLTV